MFLTRYFLLKLCLCTVRARESLGDADVEGASERFWQQRVGKCCGILWDERGGGDRATATGKWIPLLVLVEGRQPRSWHGAATVISFKHKNCRRKS